MESFAGFEHIVRDHEPLAPHTWLRLGGTAQYFAEPTSLDELTALVCRCRDQNLPVRLLGGGSNLLIREAEIAGLVIHLSAPAFSEISVAGTRITAGGGARLGHVISTAVREGLAGLEYLVGIPGTVGGALHGNSGTSSGDIGQWTSRARVITWEGQILTREADDLRFAYRQSSVDDLAIIDADFELQRENPRELTKRLQTLWIVKKSQQPRSGQNAACIFRDPDGADASSLIEQAGLKGIKIGEAEISEDNANFIIARPGATSRDVLRLIEWVREKVGERLGIELETGVEVW